MRTVAVNAVVSPEHILTAEVPADIVAGSHRVVVVIQEALSQASPSSVPWTVHPIGLMEPGMTFRREDMYGDDGR